MAKLATFISELAAVTGVKAELLKSFIEANGSLELPDEVVNGIKGGILTLEAAKNNSLLHDHFHAQALNGVDTDMDRYMSELKLDDKIISEIKAEPKTAKRVRLLASKLRDLEAEKINATGGDKKVLQEKIDALTKQVAEANGATLKQKEELQAEIAKVRAEADNHLRNYKVSEHFKSYKYANDKADANIQAKFAQTLVEEKLKELGLKIVFDKESGAVKLKTNADTDFYKENKLVDFKGLSDNLLAEAQLLKVSEPAKTGEGNHQTLSITNGQGNQRDTSKITDALNKRMAEVSVTQN